MRGEVSSIQARYAEKTPGSARLYARALAALPGGVAHDLRYLEPHPLYAQRAEGARKWDVDGNEYVDYFGGHGALLLGHNHEAVREAVARQLAVGTHFGASHELEIRWAEQIQRMVPCAQRVRFTASGTEATQLAIRLARAYTAKPRIVRFLGHFHGWHDQVAFAVSSHFDGSAPDGVLPEVARGAVVCDPRNLESVERTLLENNDIAAVIVEPTGASFGKVPLVRGFLSRLREITQAAGVPLLFDEVITGFRVAPGGAQQRYGVLPDLATFAKIVAGGFPGAAVAGRREIMDVLNARPDSSGPAGRRVPHQGTFNANPITAAAGLTTLELIAAGGPIERADAAAAELRAGMNEALIGSGLPWVVYGQSSGFHIFVNPSGKQISLAEIEGGKLAHDELKGVVPPSVLAELRCGMLLEGVDLMPWPGGCVSAAHGPAEIGHTVEAFRRVIKMLAPGARVAQPVAT